MPIYTFNGIRWDQLDKYIETPTQNIYSFNGIEVPTSGLIPYYNLTKASYGITPSSSITASYPQDGGGIQSGDLLLLYCHGENSLSDYTIFSLPLGWTSSFQYSSSVANLETALFYKISDGTEGDVNIGLDNRVTFMDVAIWYIKISNTHQTNPITVGSSTIITATNLFSVTASSLVTPTDNCLVFAGVTFDGGDGEPFSLSGTGWPSSIPPGQETEVGSLGSNLSCGWVTKTLPTAGSSSDVVFTAQFPDGLLGQQFAIRPAS